MKMKQVSLRLPQQLIAHVGKVAKLAGVSPTQVYNVFLAVYILEVASRCDAASSAAREEKK